MDGRLAMDIFDELEKCNKCEHKRGPVPFYFNSVFKKVMLITLGPSFQAVYRPLVSTRFFRVLCLALYGGNPNVDSLTNAFIYGEIYWTHYHKCYIRRTKDYPYDVPDACKSRYLDREVKALSPSLIIMLGDVVAERLLGRVPKPGEVIHDMYLGFPVLCANFPRTGCEPEFTEIRKALSPKVEGVDIESVPDYMKSRSLSAKSNIAKHAEFEIRGLEFYWNTLKEQQRSISRLKPDDGDGRWYQAELIPRWTQYSFFVLCYSFIEEQLAPLLLDLGKSYEFINNANIDTLIDAFEHQYSNNINAKFDQSLKNDIQKLRVIRRFIVHNGGRAPLEEKLNLQDTGIELHHGGMIEVGSDGCEWALGVARSFVDELIKFDILKGV